MSPICALARPLRPATQLLKHRRYPWVLPKEKCVTIAAGFLHRNGVLLCADTQVEQGEGKSDISKIHSFNCEGAKLAFAGNHPFAISTIQECEARLKRTAPKDALAVVEHVLDAEYKRVVLSLPEQATDASVHYWLLVAICPD